jgi:FkbM family methyltransferase
MRVKLRKVISRPWLQRLWEMCVKVALAGMNVGGGYGFSSSGEQNVIQLLNRSRAADGRITVFDVGAHLGEYSAEVHRVIGPDADVHCFEPDRVAFLALKDRFDGIRTLHCHRFALSNAKGEGRIVTDSPGTTTGYLQVANANDGNSDRGDTIAVCALDDFCCESDIESVDLLKMDVEGGELNVLMGASRLLSEGRIKMIQWEFGEANVRSRSYLRDFFELLEERYRIYRILQVGFAKMGSYSPTFEQFKVTNFLAILKTSSIEP